LSATTVFEHVFFFNEFVSEMNGRFLVLPKKEFRDRYRGVLTEETYLKECKRSFIRTKAKVHPQGAWW
jgi:hypothetical protein